MPRSTGIPEGMEQGISRSFVAGLFTGTPYTDSISPWPVPSREDDAKTHNVLEDVREFLRLVDPEKIEANDEVPIWMLEEMARIGLFALKVSEEHGGRGLSQHGYSRVLSPLGVHSSALAAYVSAHNSLGCLYPVLHYGTDEQKRRFLPSITRWPTGFCFTEPNVGSDPARMTTYALRVRDDDGNIIGYMLYGQKLYTTNVLRAKHLAVVALTVSEHYEAGPGFNAPKSLFIVPTNAKGVTIGHPNKFAGMRGIDNANPKFDGVFVPLRDRIGKEGQGFTIALEALNSGRIAVGAICAASVSESLRVAHEWASSRKQWGRPIGEHELIGRRLANVAAQAFALRAITDHAASLVDRGLDPRAEAAMVKVMCSEEGWRVIDDLMQIRGGRGYETAGSILRREDYAPPVERMWRDGRITRVFEGTTETMEQFVCLVGLGPYLKIAGPLMKGRPTFGKMTKAGKELFGAYRQSFRDNGWRDFLEQFPRELREHIEFVGKASRRLVRSIVEKSVRHGKKLQYKQLLMERWFCIAARLYAMTASCSRAKHIGSEEALELARVYCVLAEDEVRRLFWALRHSRSADDLAFPVARETMAGRFEFAEEV